jgi:hypothetical protein
MLMSNHFESDNLEDGLKALRSKLLTDGYEIKTESWQGKGPDEFPAHLELLHADLIVQMAATAHEASTLLKAAQPWADVHHEERVGGLPLNPPPSHTMWLRDTEKYLSKDQQAFSHSYPERMWCDTTTDGIRFKWGNLQTAVELLKKEPNTRQCYVPMWFPEDSTAALAGERVPCTFGWHFMLRDGKLHCSYHMRSCDVCRHLHNDLYFANRLVLWMIEQSGIDAVPGTLHFSATSLHCFVVDRYVLKNMVK